MYICENCKNKHNGSYGKTLKNKPKNGKSKNRFCSKTCSKSFSTKINREEINKKVSKTVIKNSINLYEKRTCFCGEKFNIRKKETKKFCNNKCFYKWKQTDEYKKQQSDRLKGKTGGYRTKSGLSKFHGSYYKGVWMDSSWELKFAKKLDEEYINLDRKIKYFFNYIDMQSNNRKYYPDFYLSDFDCFVEIKGYWTDEVKHKIRDSLKRNNFNLIILDSLNKIDKFQIGKGK